MHVFIAGLYGFTIWLSCLAAAVMLRADWVLVLWLGPVIVSAAMVVLWAADWAIWRLWAAVRRLWSTAPAPGE